MRLSAVPLGMREEEAGVVWREEGVGRAAFSSCFPRFRGKQKSEGSGGPGSRLNRCCGFVLDQVVEKLGCDLGGCTVLVAPQRMAQGLSRIDLLSSLYCWRWQDFWKQISHHLVQPS